MATNALHGKVTTLQIKNRALQLLGVSRLTLETDVSKNASAVNAVYDIARRAELRRHIWKFSLSRAELVALSESDDPIFEDIADFDDAETTYDTGQLVMSEGEPWLCIQAVTAGDGMPRLNTADWSLYKLEGATDWSATATYAADDIVYYRGRYYQASGAIVAGIHPPTNLGDNADEWRDYPSYPRATLWATGTSYSRGELVYVQESDVIYSSRTNTNSGNNPESDTTNWVRLGTAANFHFNPPHFDRTKAFPLPEDFLRFANPHDPKYRHTKLELLLEGRQILSDDAGPLSIRYCRDVINPREFDPLFVEALAAKIAFECCEELTNSTAKLENTTTLYDVAVKDAAQIDAIERGPTEPEIDDFEAVRL